MTINDVIRLYDAKRALCVRRQEARVLRTPLPEGWALDTTAGFCLAAFEREVAACDRWFNDMVRRHVL